MISIAGYKIIEKIYESRSSIVYRGHQKSNNQPVIIKALKEDYPSPHEIAKYRQEYNIYKNFEIERIIQSYNYILSEHSPAIIFEDFGAESLNVLVDKGKLRFKSDRLILFLNIAIQIAEALVEIHENQIIHKDINPSNIVLNLENQQLKIIDFGISILLDRETTSIKSPEALEGTLAYISPEQTGRMNRTLDYRTDFYSLGITLYELFTGQLPFTGNDPLELIHYHIAKEPIPPHEINQDIPKPISKIIMKLMNKNAENRYQSAYGLKKDLEYCLENIVGLKEINNFSPGELDFSNRFNIPQKLYGREAEIRTILQAFNRASMGTIEMMMIGGYSGIGKTSLIYDLQKPVVEKKGYFISGKFDQYKKDIPYYALIQAFQGLIKQILTESFEKILTWKKEILSSLGVNAQVIIDVIPELELIIDKQPDIPKLPPNESYNRFNFVFQNFAKTFASIDHPLVIFLDDLQWADLASLKLLEILMADIDAKYILIIGAYRDNEVNTAHPLTLTLDEIRKDRSSISEIFLNPLLLVDVQQLVADTLRSEVGKVRELAELIIEKSLGNPFFINQLLQMFYIDKFIVFNSNEGQWNIEILKIKEAEITENVIDLMLNKIMRLPRAIQDILKLAACIGNVFDLETLSIISRNSTKETEDALFECLKQGFVYPLDDSYQYLITDDKLFSTTKYKFLHDRIQQAAYSLIHDENKKRFHLKVGKLLLENPDHEDNIFEIANHFNSAIDLITDPKERESVAQLNLLAGEKAKKSAAYQPSFSYFKTGISFLTNNDWELNYTLMLSLHINATETAYLNSNFDEMAQFAGNVDQFAKSTRDKIKIYEVKLLSCQAQHKMLEAVKIAAEILNLLGCNFPTSPTPEIMQNAFAETSALLADKSPMDLLDLPPMDNHDILAVMKILISADTSFYQVAPELYVLSALKQVQLSIQYGNAPESPCGYATYAVVLCGVLNDINTGYQFGKLAMKLLDRTNSSKRVKIMMLFHVHIWHWKNHLRESFKALFSIYKTGQEIGDIEFMAHTGMNYCFYAFFSGRNLSELTKEIVMFGNSMKQTKQDVTLLYLNILHQVIINLCKHAESRCRLNGDVYCERHMLPFHNKNNDKAGLFTVYFGKMLLNYLFENYAQAVKYASIAERNADGVAGWVAIPVFYFYASLSYLALAKEQQNTEQGLIEKVISNQVKMKNWADHAPMNYLHKYYLVHAELMAFSNKYNQAEEFYDKAIELAGKTQYTNDEAIANELAAKFFYRRGKPKFAKVYMTDAYYGYEKWGAISKIDDMREKYDFLFIKGAIRNQLTIGSESITISTGIHSDTLDLTSVLKASQIISGEIVLEKLLKKLMKTVIENAGAQKGCLILKKNSDLFVEIQADIQGNISEILQSVPVKNNQSISESIVNYSMRTGNNIVLFDAGTEGLFTQDPYILKYSPKSILCSPLKNQGKLIGLLYLENNLTTNAFTEDKLHILDLLTAQIAVSIENASLYNNLEQKVQERTAQIGKQKKEIEDSAKELKESNRKLIEMDKFKQAMMSMIVHDLKNPLNYILNISSLNVSEKQLKEVRNSGKQMLNMVMNILDVHKFEDAQMTLEIQSYPLFDVSQRAIDQVRFLSEKKNIHIQNLIPQELKVEIDLSLIERVFVNLLNNAIKYTSNNGKILLEVDKLSLLPNTHHNMVKVMISDTGQGIPEDKLDVVFDKFKQIKKQSAGQIGSTGLGLTFCRLAIQGHQGDIGVISKMGEGSTFWFTLKIDQAVTYKSAFHPIDREKKESRIERKHQLKKIEQDILSPFIKDLASIEVYEISRLRKILKQLEAIENENIQFWKNNLEDIIRTGDDVRYKEFIAS